MISRRILVVKTKGSRQRGNLAPNIQLPRGLNLLVLEYRNSDAEAVVEIWASDHRSLKDEERISSRKMEAEISKLRSEPSFVDELPSHSKSPPAVGQIIRLRENGTEKILDKG